MSQDEIHSLFGCDALIGQFQGFFWFFFFRFHFVYLFLAFYDDNYVAKILKCVLLARAFYLLMQALLEF